MCVGGGLTTCDDTKPTIASTKFCVLAEKNFEPLDAILKACEARLEQRYQTKKKKWKTDSNAELEKSRLEMFRNCTIVDGTKCTTVEDG